MAAAVGWYALAYSPIAFPNANLAVIMILSTVIVFFVSYVYGQLSAAMPRSGGDYVWLSRIVHPALGFMMNFYFTAYLLIIVGLIVVPTILMPSLAGALVVTGSVTNNPAFIDWASAAVTPTNATIIGVVVITIGCLLNVMRVKTFYKVMAGMLVISLAGLVLTIALLYTIPTSAFAANLDQLTKTSGAYGNILKQAADKGFVSGWTIGASLLGLPFGVQSLTGWQLSAYLGGEVKTPNRKLPMSIVLALLINGILYALLYHAMYTGLGFDFVNAAVYLQTLYPNLYPSGSPALLPYFMVALPVNPALVVFAVFSFFIASLWLIVTYYPFATRNMLAWSFDGVTPRMLADVNDRFGTPIKAVALSWVFSVIGVFVAYYTGWASATSNMIVGYNFMLTVVMVVAMAFPYLKNGKPIFEAAPPLTKQKIGSLPVIVLFALIGAIGTSYTFYSGLTNPLVGGAITPASGGFVVALFILPLVIYYAAKAYNMSKGIDITLAFKQLPPE